MEFVYEINPENFNESLDEIDALSEDSDVVVRFAPGDYSFTNETYELIPAMLKGEVVEGYSNVNQKIDNLHSLSFIGSDNVQLHFGAEVGLYLHNIDDIQISNFDMFGGLIGEDVNLTPEIDEMYSTLLINESGNIELVQLDIYG